MSDSRTYTDHSNSILMGDYEKIIKSIIRQLFERIYKEIKEYCSLEEPEKKDINEFLNWPDDYDLNSTARYFIWRYFNHKIVQKVTKTKKFSLGDILDIANSRKFKTYPMEKRRLVKQLEVKKNFKFSIYQINETAVICNELIRLRNLSAHNNGLKHASQAMILMSNLSRLLNITPDYVRERTNGFDHLEQYVKGEFLNSILSVVRPDIEDAVEEALLQAETKTEEDNDVFNEILINKIDDLDKKLKRLEGLESITSSVLKSEEKLADIQSFIYTEKKSSERQWRFDNEKTKDDKDTYELKKPQVESISSEEKIETKADIPSRSEMYDILMEFRVKIKKEMTSEFSGFRNWHNLLMTHIANSIIDNKITSKKSLKEDPTFQHYYDSKQIYGKLLEKFNKRDIEEKQKTATEFFDIQIDRHWSEIQELLKEYFSQA